MLDLTGRTSFCDAFIVCSANNPRHVRAIANHALHTLRHDHGVNPLGVEGVENGRWALLDFGDVLVHIFEAPVRKYYNLEGLWMDAHHITPEELGVTVHAPLPGAEEPDPDEPDFDGPEYAPPVLDEEEQEDEEEPEDFYGQAPTA